MTHLENKMKAAGLPNLTFMFTIDQIASLLNIQEESISGTYLFYKGRSTGVKKIHHMEAINIAPTHAKPDWRVSLEEYRKWLKRMGFTARDMTRL